MKRVIKKLLRIAGLIPSPNLSSRYRSETSRCRRRLAPYCQGYGIDVGFGGDAISTSAIRVDLPKPYADTGDQSVQLGGDARDLKWFADASLDYVYSSHLLEDFEDTERVLREWLRVLRQGGVLIIFCPDEQLYRKHCKRTGQPYNPHHIHDNFSLESVKAALASIGGTKVVHEVGLVDEYSWELVAEKTAAL